MNENNILKQRDEIVKQREKTYELYNKFINGYDQFRDDELFFYYSKLSAKIARICRENARMVEHWEEIVFYATLAIDTIKKEQNQPNSQTIEAAQKVQN